MSKKGFTLIELIISLTIITLVAVGFIGILVAMLNLQTSQSATAEVNQQGQSLLQQIQYYISSARLIDMTVDASSSVLSLRELYTPYPTTLSLSNGVVYIISGNNAAQPITSSNVFISNLSFTHHYNLDGSSTPYGVDSVSFSFTMSAVSTNNKSYTQSFQSSASVLVQVGKIALIQETSTTSLSQPASTTISLSYPTNNEAGDLLVAVLASQVTSTQIFSMQANGVPWTQVGGVIDTAFGNEQIGIFDYPNASSSLTPVTVFATQQATFSSTSLFLFEYRGAATSSSFDSSSSQIQGNNGNPSSGFANPTSTVELILGVIHNDNTNEVPSVGPGFTLEASSTLQTFAEDSLQYITGPVAASWQYLGTPTSSVIIATFK